MFLKWKALMIVAIMIAWIPASSAERMTSTSQDAFACVSWAAWHEYGLASLTARGARMSKTCPLRIASKTKVTVLDEDAGEGAAEIRYLGQTWFIDSQRLK